MHKQHLTCPTQAGRARENKSKANEERRRIKEKKMEGEENADKVGKKSTKK